MFYNKMADYKSNRNKVNVKLKKLMILCIGLMIFTKSASAHVMNSNNVYEDLALTDAANDIVLLTSLNLVTAVDDSKQFKPQQTLSAEQFAAWVANYNGLQADSTVELAKLALEKNYVITIDGDATYEMVNEAFFQNTVALDEPTATMTHEQFAAFVVDHLTENFFEKRN